MPKRKANSFAHLIDNSVFARLLYCFTGFPPCIPIVVNRFIHSYGVASTFLEAEKAV